MEYDEFLERVAPRMDLAWRKYRRRTSRRAVRERIRRLGLPGYEAYLEYLDSHPAEAAELPDRMRVTVSRFYRDREQWETLGERVLPSLVRDLQTRTPDDTTLRAWSAGACSGEEPYTLALLWLERPKGRSPEVQIEITATDIDVDTLSRARHGAYQGSSLREVPDFVRQRWFREEGPEMWRIAKEPRSLVRFRRHNLLLDEPPAERDLVLCRYLALTYFTGRRLAAAVERLAAALKPGGALMIGAKEDPGDALEDHFDPWPQAPGFYRRRSFAGPLGAHL